MKIASVLMLGLSLAMFYLAYELQGRLTVSAAVVNALGFLVVAYVFWTHDHNHTH